MGEAKENDANKYELLEYEEDNRAVECGGAAGATVGEEVRQEVQTPGLETSCSGLSCFV